jgi:poly-gamma-glutamate capsule biosynthesis protein CapA/YwtB (metallophosphatase superfamily)
MIILIGADLVPTKSNIDNFSKGDITGILGKELLGLWNSADIRLFNLEVPLCDNEDPIEKCGPNLIAPTNTINGIKVLNPSLIALANNHILDHGAQGLKSTKEILTQNGIPFIGAGDTLNEASKPYIIEKSNLKIGIYACAEHEFSIAKENSPGANPFDPLESLDHIKSLKEECDYVIVLYHGGKEHYRYPSPYLQKVCRKIVQKGADIVICQHSHCIGCCESYEGSTIVYGQGNFIFDHSDSEFWETSLLVKVTMKENVNIDYVPIVKNGNGVRLAVGSEAEEILNNFHQRSREILNAEFVEKQYREFALSNYYSYIRKISGLNSFISKLDRRLFNDMLVKHKYNKKQLLAIQNYIECEAHNELVLAGLKENIQIERE